MDTKSLPSQTVAIDELMARLGSSSAVMGNLPENPGYNGSILLIDDVEAERVSADIQAAILHIESLERELAEAKAEIKGWDDSYARWCVLMVKRGVHAFGFLDDAINALYDRAVAAENAKAAAVRAAKAYEWGYEYVKDRMKSIGRDGWAHDCDSEIEARKEGQ